MLDEALTRGRPDVFNTDQGEQFTAEGWTARVEAAWAAVSMGGRGRAADNVFVERLWQSVKTEPTTTAARRTRCRAGYNGPVISFVSGRQVRSLQVRSRAMAEGVPRTRWRSG